MASSEKSKQVVKRIKRRQFLGGAAALSSSSVIYPISAAPDSWRTPGAPFSNYGVAGDEQESAIRWITSNPAAPGDGVSWSPLHELEGTVTPNGLHFERHHNGVPKVEGAGYELAIHGAVEKPMAFSLNNLRQYPQVSRQLFIECGGNSSSYWLPEPARAQVGHLHGLISNAEWTGVPLAWLLDQVAPTAEARWLIVDGHDAAGVTVSIPFDKAMQDVIVALYQNGEAIRPENGYPARLVVPGWEGIVNVKWIRSIQLARQPLMSRFDTVSYTDLQKDGRARRFTFEMGVKSVLTSPASGDQLASAGVYELRGLAWSGAGRIDRVEVSADGGANWRDATLQEPVLDYAWVRFRAPWEWTGEAAILQSRATDSAGRVQPTRAVLLEEQGNNAYYHYNGIVSWAVDEDGVVENSYL